MRRLAGIACLLTAGALAGCGGSSDSGIQVPDGFSVTTVASGIGQPSNLTFDRRGGLWTTSAGYGNAASDGVWFTPRPGASPVHVIRGVRAALGLAWFRGSLYVSHVVGQGRAGRGQVTAFSGFDGRRFRSRRTVLGNLPTGAHQIDSITPGPGGRLYVGVGSFSDTRRGRDPLAASVVSFPPSGHGARAVARGLRNPYGLAFIPGTSDLLISDNGRDLLGANRPPDELNVGNVARPPDDFGFPGCFGQGGAACRGTTEPLAALAPHAAAGGVAVARRLGPYGLSAFVAENGSTIRPKPSGNVVVRVSLRRAGSRWVGTEHPFAHGFAEHDPLGAAIGPDGDLYLALHSSGQVVRIAPRHSVQSASTKG